MIIISDKVIEMTSKNATDAKREKRKRFGKIKKIKEETLAKVNQHSTDWLDNHKVKKIYMYIHLYYSLLILYISAIQ